MCGGLAASRWFGAVSLLALLLSGSDALAQSGVLHGMVVDTDGTPVPEADVAVVALRQLARTDAEGRFTFRRLPRGEIEVSVRRLGFQPVRRDVALSGGIDTVRIMIEEQPAQLTAVQTSASEIRRRVALEEFYRRRARGIGTFFTREEIDTRKASVTSDVLRTTPGVRFVRGRGGLGIRFNTALGRRDCVPLMFVDGQRAPGMEIDDFPVRDIEGIELYQTQSTTPMQFSPDATSACGVIVVWSRVPGT